MYRTLSYRVCRCMDDSEMNTFKKLKFRDFTESKNIKLGILMKNFFPAEFNKN